MTLPSSSFLRLVKCTRLDLFEGQNYMASIWYPLQACVKIKRYSPKWWGKNGTIVVVVGSMSLLNMALVCIRVGLGTSHLVASLCLRGFG